ncbi:hypothetical protein [Parvularcula lutaonensis]|uniref:Uncharacterized protein n=1 Tax=Parvularcula lutaonensis TaxID=491923 RepID=A0ABV7MEX1_9PROT|nr:hypothetical protein [Parvularcula lutaonensis]GGY40777.1 hypothetical protein GCM10007148_06650 [Parvularcula lutaonensis]
MIVKAIWILALWVFALIAFGFGLHAQGAFRWVAFVSGGGFAGVLPLVVFLSNTPEKLRTHVIYLLAGVSLVAAFIVVSPSVFG